MATQLLYAHFDWVTQGNTLAWVESSSGPGLLLIDGLTAEADRGARFGVYNGFDGVVPGALPSVWATGWIQANLYGRTDFAGGSYLLARMQGLTFDSQAYILQASNVPDSLESSEALQYALYLYKASPGEFRASDDGPAPLLGEHAGLLCWKALGEAPPFPDVVSRLEVINAGGRAILRVLLQGELFFEVEDPSPLPAGRWGLGGFTAGLNYDNPDDVWGVYLDNLSFKLP